MTNHFDSLQLSSPYWPSQLCSTRYTYMSPLFNTLSPATKRRLSKNLLHICGPADPGLGPGTGSHAVRPAGGVGELLALCVSLLVHTGRSGSLWSFSFQRESPSRVRDATQWSSKSRKLHLPPFFAHFLLVPRKPILAQRETSPEQAKGGKG